MKSILIVLGLTFSSITFSQILFGGYAGIGVGSSEPKDESFFPQKAKLTYAIGGEALVLLAEKWQLGGGLEFFNVGHNVDLTFADNNGIIGDGVTRSNINYIGIPVSIGYRLGSDFVITPKINLIPAFMVGSYQKFIVPPEITLISNKNDQKGETNNFNFSVGAGIEFSKVGEQIEWFSSLEYRHSLTAIYTPSVFDPDPSRHFGGYLKFGLRYSFIPVDKN